MAYHIRDRRPYKPSMIRSELESSIRAFPNNTIFLALHAETEARHRIDDRIRGVMRDSVLYTDQSTVIGWVFALTQEIARYQTQTSGSTAQAVRSTFQRALMGLESPSAHSVVIWEMYFDFEESQIEKEGKGTDSISKKQKDTCFARLRQVFLDGLRYLPFSKSWILRGLRFFDRDDGYGWSRRDLKSVWNVLLERDMRIRVEGFEEMLGKSDGVCRDRHRVD